MARPHKQGIDYFSLDVVLDDKFELFEAEFGLQGFGFIIKLFQKVYESNGYYYKWSEDEKLLFSKKVNVDINLINDYINSALKRDIFNKNIYEKYNILTSKGIQKRFLEASKRRKGIEIVKAYFLIDMENSPEYKDVNSNVVYVSNDSGNNNSNEINDDNNSQSKGKEIKEKEIEIINKQFESFWSLYPKKVKKQKAKEWFEKNKPTEELAVIMITALKKFVNSKEWKDSNGQFIPHPTTWLNQKRWEDLSEGGFSIGSNEKHNNQYDEARGTTL